MLDPKTKKILVEHAKDLGIKIIELAGQSIIELSKNLATARIHEIDARKKNIDLDSLTRTEKEAPYHAKR